MAGEEIRQVPDQELVERYACDHHEGAFGELMRRHGQMILGVCRRVLTSEQDVEDAFQATFLLLARKAGSIRKRQSVASWLYGVARFVALRARTAAGRRRRHEGCIPRRMQAEDPLSQITVREAQGLLDEELRRLPERYRAPLVLCFLEGATQDEAARRLGWSLSNMKRRLEQARLLLHKRLTRRGLTLAAALGVAGFTPGGIPAAAPPALVAATIQAASQPAGLISTQVRVLMEAGLQALALARLKLFAAFTLGLCLVAALMALAARQVWNANDRRAGTGDRVKRVAKAPGPERAARPPLQRQDRYGDPLPPGALVRFGTVRLRHGSNLTAFAFSPDGKILAAAEPAQTIRLWDTATGKERGHIQTNHAGGLALAFSRDGKTLVGAGRMAGNTGRQRITAVKRWDVATGKPLRPFPAGKGSPPEACAACFSVDGTRVALAGFDNSIHLFDLATGTEIGQWASPRGGISSLALSPRGKILAAAGGDNTIRLWQTAPARALRPLNGHQAHVFSLSFPPDGKTLASRSQDRTIRLWDAATGKPLGQVPVPHNHTGPLRFGPGGKTLITGGEDKIFHVWDTTTRKEIRRFKGSASWFAAVSPNGKLLVAGGWANAVQFWDIATGKELRVFQGHTASVGRVAFSPDGKKLATTSMDQTLRLWEAATGNPLFEFAINSKQDWPVGYAVDLAAVILARQDHTMRLVRLADRKTLAAFRGHTGGVTTATLSPDGKTLASGGLDQTTRLWSTATGKELRRLVFPKEIQGRPGALLFAPDGKTLISGSRHVADGAADAGGNGTICLWDPATGNLIRRMTRPDFSLGPLALAHDGRTLASGEENGTIRIWDPATGKERYPLLGQQGRVHALAFSPDDQTLAAAGPDHTIRLWEVPSGQAIGRLVGHRAPVGTLAFSRDGTTLASGSDDTTALLWDLTGLRTGKQVAPVKLARRDLEALWAELANRDAGQGPAGAVADDGSARASRYLLANPFAAGAGADPAANKRAPYGSR
jgi:RNA polymerase sigma factor (sigma-70 family)